MKKAQGKPLNGVIGSIAGFVKMYFVGVAKQHVTVTVAIVVIVKVNTATLPMVKERASSAELRKKTAQLSRHNQSSPLPTTVVSDLGAGPDVVLALPESARSAVGARGRAWIVANFDAAAAARSTLNLYAELAGRRRP